MQVNYLVPTGLVAGPAIVTITGADGAVSTGTVQIVVILSRLTPTGNLAALALRVRADGTQAREAITQFDAGQNEVVPVPIDLGSEGEKVYLVLFGTGIRFGGALSNVAVTIGDVTVPVEYSGVQGGFAGLDQVNLRLPRTLAGSGQKDLKLTISGIQANVVKVSIQ